MSLKREARTAYTSLGSNHRWTPGIRQTPYLGLGALLLAVVGVAVSAVILVASNNVEISSWKFQPTVYLSISSTVTNIATHYALWDGVTTAWWLKAMEDRTSIADLHRVWDYGNSFWAAAVSGRHINTVGLACIFVAISPINGPLLQRASRVVTVDRNITTALALSIAPRMPLYYTGYMSSRSEIVATLTPDFSPVVRDYYSQVKVHMDSACQSVCPTHVLGPGFAVQCSSYTVPYNMKEMIGGTLVNGSLQNFTINFNDTQIFGSNVVYDVYRGNPAIVHVGTQFKGTVDCTGNLTVENCTLRAGMVEYPVVVDGPSATISLDPTTSIWDDIVVGPMDNLTSESLYTGTTYGGMYLALANRFQSSMTMRFGGPVGYEIFSPGGEVANAYAIGTSGFYSNCSLHFKSPMGDFLQTARELMFRTAVAAANSSTVQHVSANETIRVNVYRSQYLFLGLASLASFIAVLLVALTFNGFWLLGRNFSLSPIETAKAFDAPMLRNNDSNAPVGDLLKDVGGRQVKYGAVSRHRGISQPDRRSISAFSTGYEPPDSPEDETPPLRLQFADPRSTLPIQTGWKFGG